MAAHPTTESATRLERLEEWLLASPATREQAVRLAQERIRSMDGSLRAWVEVLPQAPTGDGSLAGVPFGAKDIIETEGLATEYGSPIYKGRRGTTNAAIIRRLRDLGAILLGKTQTTAFAHRTPAPTRNPRNGEHTPPAGCGRRGPAPAGRVPSPSGPAATG